jgi:lipoyl(octanoyl) transferase
MPSRVLTKAGSSSAITVRRLGRVDYDEALEMQRALVEDRRAGRIGDTLLLLEHPPIITLGVRSRGASPNVLASPDALAHAGVTLRESGRGGDVTFHGPGQLVGYPIFDLRPDRCDVHRYVRDIEAALIGAMAEFGIEGRRVQGHTGVWAGPDGREEKLAAIGVRISRWITSHGFALNVSVDLKYFQLIVPCGIADRGVTSMEKVLGRPVAMDDVGEAIVRNFENVFGSGET